MIRLVCEHCGCEFFRARRNRVKGKPQRFCSPGCRYAKMSGSEHPNWGGGRYVPKSVKEYITVICHGHPRAHHGRVKEHILIMEKLLGRPLPDGAEVHHLDGDTKNNYEDNLYLCRGRHHHMVMEAASDRIRSCGNIGIRRCNGCKALKTLDHFPRNKNNWDGRHNECKRCNRERVRKYAEKKDLR